MAEAIYKPNSDLELDGKLMISVGGQLIAFGTSAKLTVNTDMLDTTNMMSGDWKDEAPGTKSFAVTSEALLTRKTQTTSAESLLHSQLTDAQLDFVFGEFNRTGDEIAGYSYPLDTTKTSYTGKIRITSMELTGETTKLKKYTMSANGCGPLTEVPAVPAG